MKRILLSNGAFLGDLILSTAVLPALKTAYPGVEIGFLIGSWSLPVVENHLYVDRIHLFDHPHLSRAPFSSKEKKCLGNAMWHQAVHEIEQCHYDLAIDLYYFYKANSAALLAKANIPRIAGFWGSPSHFFYTEKYFWNHVPLHMVESHAVMLKSIGLQEAYLPLVKPTLVYKDDSPSYSLPTWCEKGKYLAIHVGAGDPRRLWNGSAWKRLIQKLNTIGSPIVFLGKGNYEQKLIQELLPLASLSIDLSDRVSWRQLSTILQNARLFIGLESMAGHLAAVCNTPSVVMYGYPPIIPCWRPFSALCHIVTTPQVRHRLPHKFAGLQLIDPDRVFRKITEVLKT